MTLLRGLRHRAGTSLAILALAVFAVAAAAAGPIYNAAARGSILHDTFAAAPVSGRDLQATGYGDVTTVASRVQNLVTAAIADAVVHASDIPRLFERPVTTLTVTAQRGTSQFQLVYRQGACAALRFTAGRCPRAAGEIAVSPRTAADSGLRVGQRLSLSPVGRVTVVGIYAPPDVASPVWLNRGSTLFPQEVLCAQLSGCPKGTDAVFTPSVTLLGLPQQVQAGATLDWLVRRSRLTPGDIPTLAGVATEVSTNAELYESQVSVATTISTTVGLVRASWRTLSVPIVIVSLEVLLLAWALQFLIVSGAAEARAAEIALAKLRGFGRLRALRFGLAEPTALLAVALPVGVAIGWLAMQALSRVLLRPHTAVPLPGLAWLAAGLATLGGMLAVGLGARASLVRPVIEQWRRTTRHANRRGWILDAVVGVAALAGLTDLLSSGGLRSTAHDPVALLVPGLLGIAVAVTASRVLPLLATLVFASTRRRGGLAGFLAARHIARRPAATRTMAILTAACTLAVFGIASYTVGQGNRTTAADLSVGAPTVFTVAAVPPNRLIAAVQHIDPAGRTAAAVLRSSSGGPETLAVQPARFAAVANWPAAGVGAPAALLRPLTAPVAAPITVTGGRLRIEVRVGRLFPSHASLTLDVATQSGTGDTPVTVGPLLAHRTLTRTVSLPAQRVQIVDLDVAPGLESLSSAPETTGRLLVTALQEPAGRGGWRAVPGALHPGRWRSKAPGGAAAAGPHGALQWVLASAPRSDAVLVVADLPAQLPGIVAGRRGIAAIQSTGLDGGPLRVRPTRQLNVIPGSPGSATVVTLTDAVRASNGSVTAATEQVWTDGDPAAMAGALRRTGLHILATDTSADLQARLTRAGPGLASVMFLADAGAAALLAALGTVLGLTTAARRRRYEYAALATSGLSRRTLFAAVAAEQGAVVVMGLLAGIAAGVVAVALVLRDVPEFVTRPPNIPLTYQPSAVVLAVALGCGLAGLLALTLISAWRLLRSIGVDRLREGPA